jgi:hypothetical protein
VEALDYSKGTMFLDLKCSEYISLLVKLQIWRQPDLATTTTLSNSVWTAAKQRENGLRLLLQNKGEASFKFWS